MQVQIPVPWAYGIDSSQIQIAVSASLSHARKLQLPALYACLLEGLVPITSHPLQCWSCYSRVLLQQGLATAGSCYSMVLLQRHGLATAAWSCYSRVLLQQHAFSNCNNLQRKCAFCGVYCGIHSTRNILSLSMSCRTASTPVTAGHITGLCTTSWVPSAGHCNLKRGLLSESKVLRGAILQ